MTKIEEQKENIKEKYLKYCDTRFVNTFMKDIETLTLTAQKQVLEDLMTVHKDDITKVILEKLEAITNTDV